MSSKQPVSVIKPATKPVAKLTKEKRDLVECDGCGDRIVHRDDYGAYRANGYWCSRLCAYGDIIEDIQRYR